jgi:formylglycine-generating enzyme required for sulfatase activity
MSLRWFTSVTAACFVSCASTPELPPAGQVLLYVDTDAPLAPADAPPLTTTDPIPLFDRLRIDASSADGEVCSDCTRVFDVTSDMFRARSVSFGILAPVGGGSVRARLFRSGGTLTGEPNPDSTIDVTATLPSIAATGITPTTLLLKTDDTGQPTTVTLAPGAPSTSLVGSWPGARRIDCAAPPKPGEVCIPGGAYWMGNPLADYVDMGDGNRQRIAVMSPFYIDATEVTVAAYRRSGLVPSFGWSGSQTGASQDYCTYTSSPGPFDAYPINCLAWYEGRKYCQSQGKDLPTEAQHEYVASGLAGLLYSWGSDVPACADAVIARAGAGDYSSFFGECRTTRWGGPEVPGSGARDRVELPTGTVVDLAGNLMESTLDLWAPLTNACWSRAGVYTNPFCGPISLCTSGMDLVTSRGGNWVSSPFEATAAMRQSVDCGAVDPIRGVRCARAIP